MLNWRRRKPPQITTWLHTQAPFVALWRHGWPRIVEIERDGEKVREVWSGTWNCWESEEVLRKQYRRDRDGGRVLPPERCPICLLADWLRRQVEAGKLSWVEPVLRLEGDDPEQAITFTAAGIYNGFGGDLSRAEKAELRRAGIRLDEAWKQSCMAKCSYVFCVVDDDEPTEAHVAIETTALGDAVKRVVRDQMDALGDTEGNPLRTPYAIRWEYHPEEAEFGRKYRALALPKQELTPEVRALIVDTPPPDTSGVIRRGDALALRAVMESAALIDLPFDKLFAHAEQSPAPKSTPKSTPPKSTPPKRRPRKTRPAEPTQPDYPEGTVLLPCDACGAQMADTDEKCWKCGATYELDGEPAGEPAGSDDQDDMPW